MLKCVLVPGVGHDLFYQHWMGAPWFSKQGWGGIMRREGGGSNSTPQVFNDHSLVKCDIENDTMDQVQNNTLYTACDHKYLQYNHKKNVLLLNQT